MTLFDATRDLHHACEAHPVGQAMVNGGVTPAQWAGWLWAMRLLHQVVDPALPDHMDRHGALTADLASLPKAPVSKAALAFAHELVGQDVAGAAYVLHGAHLSGGRVLAPKMAKRGLPTAHTSYRDPEAVRAWLGEVRGRVDCAEQARRTFGCLLDCMGEIESYPAR
jgi:heme oxygenase